MLLASFFTVQRLVILTHVELTRDPRARRAALAAVAYGWNVVGICPETAAAPVPLAGVRIVRVRGERLAPGRLRLGLGGIGTRQRPLVRELRGVYRLLRLVRTNYLLARAGQKLGPVGAVHANEIETLPAGWLIRRRRGGRLVYDAHEVYASVEPDQPRLHRAVAVRLERALARRSDAVTTVSEPIAAELEQQLRLRHRPEVVLNCPHLVEDVDQPAPSGRLRAVYQGAMGPGRPLADLLDAAESADGVDIAIRVANADLDALRKQVERRGLEGRVSVLEPVPPTELVEALSGFGVGLIINRPVSRNDELVFPNKLFEYLMAGLAVVVPALPSLAAFVSEHSVGLTFPPGDAAAMGLALSRLADDPDTLLQMRRRARAIALERFNAEAQEQALVAVWS
jgi:glycosyltransferase involved in cell wall biosynthesis